MATAGHASHNQPRQPGALTRWWQRLGANRRQIDHAVWDLRERYGAAACGIARASAAAPVGFERRRFWRKVAQRLERLGQGVDS